MSVTPADLAVALGQDAPDPDTPVYGQWQMWIGDAEMLIRVRKDQLSITDPIDMAKLDYVVRESVVAHIRKPDDSTQVTISVDDGSSSKTYKSGTGRVTIRDEWWTLLGLTNPSGAFSIDMIGAGTIHQPWCALNFGALYCSCGADIAGTPIYELGDDW